MFDAAGVLDRQFDSETAIRNPVWPPPFIRVGISRDPQVPAMKVNPHH